MFQRKDEDLISRDEAREALLFIVDTIVDDLSEEIDDDRTDYERGYDDACAELASTLRVWLEDGVDLTPGGVLKFPHGFPGREDEE